MRFCYLKDDYISFLKKFDPKVADNKNEKRPYVGVILEIGSIKYYAPFTSPKQKHRSMSNGKDFRKIAGGSLGAINFNNMIPVPDCALIHFEISSIADVRYRRLLQNQYAAIMQDWKNVINTATQLRYLLTAPEEQLSSYEITVKSRCCNLAVLEEHFMEYTD